MSLSMPESSGTKRRPLPPVGKRFQKGVSGNPGGLPKGLAEFQQVCRGYTPQALQALVKGLQSDNGNVQIAAAKELLDRGWGKSAEIISASLTINMSADDRMRRIGELLTLLNMQVIDGRAEVLAIEAAREHAPDRAAGVVIDGGESG